MRRVIPLRDRRTRSARGLIRSRRPGALASWSSASYSASDSPCAPRSSSSRRRVSRAWASGTNAGGHGARSRRRPRGAAPRPAGAGESDVMASIHAGRSRSLTTHTTRVDVRLAPGRLADPPGPRASIGGTEDRMTDVRRRRAPRPLSGPRRSSTTDGRWRSSTARAGRQVPDTVIDAVAATTASRTRTTAAPFLTSERQRRDRRRGARGARRPARRGRPAEIKFGANMTTLTIHIARSIARDDAPGRRDRRDGPRPRGERRAVAGARPRDRGLTVRTAGIRARRRARWTSRPSTRSSTVAPKLVAVGWASNAVGTINPVAELVARAHAAGALTYVDAVHAAPHLPIDVQAVGTDFLACSVYKFFGPHVGVLYGRRGRRSTRCPTYKLRPADDRFETGTLQLRGARRRRSPRSSTSPRSGATVRRAAGSRATTRRRRGRTRGWPRSAPTRWSCSGASLDGLEAIPGLRLCGITDRARFDERTPTAALTIEGDRAARRCREALGARASRPGDGDFYATGLIERLGPRARAASSGSG